MVYLFKSVCVQTGRCCETGPCLSAVFSGEGLGGKSEGCRRATQKACERQTDCEKRRGSGPKLVKSVDPPYLKQAQGCLKGKVVDFFVGAGRLGGAQRCGPCGVWVFSRLGVAAMGAAFQMGLGMVEKQKVHTLAALRNQEGEDEQKGHVFPFLCHRQGLSFRFSDALNGCQR